MRSIEESERAGIAARITTHLFASARKARVADVRIGLGYTAVMLADGSVGLAYTFRHETNSTCTAFDRLRPLVRRPVSDLLELIGSPDRIEAGIGLAAANSIGNRDSKKLVNGDVLTQLDIRSDDNVAMVGYFAPLAEAITKRARALTVFERIDQPDGMLRPAHEAQDAMPKCQVVFITATSIINHTIDGLLTAARGCREVVVLGASTPLLPEAFERTPVTMLSGVLVKDPQDVMRVISEGGGMRLFSPHVRKVSLRILSTEDQREGLAK